MRRRVAQPPHVRPEQERLAVVGAAAPRRRRRRRGTRDRTPRSRRLLARRRSAVDVDRQRAWRRIVPPDGGALAPSSTGVGCRHACESSTPAQMREADRATIDDVGMPSIVLMENAGRQVVAALESLYDDLTDQRVAILAGKGNNGGDGFVVARTLHPARRRRHGVPGRPGRRGQGRRPHQPRHPRTARRHRRRGGGREARGSCTSRRSASTT